MNFKSVKLMAGLDSNYIYSSSLIGSTDERAYWQCLLG